MRNTTDTKAQAADDRMFNWILLAAVALFVGSVTFNQVSEAQRKAIAECAPNCQMVSPTGLIGWAFALGIAFFVLPMILWLRSTEWRKHIQRGDNE